MNEPYSLVSLAEVLRRVSRSEKPDPAKEYRLLGVRLDGQGPFLREAKMGSQISATTLYQVKDGDFVYSRLFAWRGAFGIIGKNLDGCYISAEFPTFNAVPERVDLRYLNYWLKLPTTLEKVEADCSGSTPVTRNRFKEEFFLRLQIPLPPLSEQRRIVARIEELAAQIREAHTLRHQAAEEAETLLGAELRMFFRFKQPQILLGDALQLHRGFDLPKQLIIPGPHPVIGSNGEIARHAESRVKGPGVCTGRSGSVGAVNYVEEDFWPHNTTLYVSDFKGNNPRLIYYLLLSVALDLRGVGAHTAVPTLDRKKAHSQIRVYLPSLSVQPRIVAHLHELQAKVDALNRLLEKTSKELDALLPSILDKAFKGEL